MARYQQNKQFYPATIEQITEAPHAVIVKWDDGDTQFRRIPKDQANFHGCRIVDNDNDNDNDSESGSGSGSARGGNAAADQQRQHAQSAGSAQQEHQPCKPGSRVAALYEGNGQWYHATIEKITTKPDAIVVAWDDGDPQFRRLPVSQTHIRGCQVGGAGNAAAAGTRTRVKAGFDSAIPNTNTNAEEDQTDSMFFQSVAWQRIHHIVMSKVNSTGADEDSPFFSPARSGREQLHRNLTSSPAYRELVREGWTSQVHKAMLRTVSSIETDAAKMVEQIKSKSKSKSGDSDSESESEGESELSSTIAFHREAAFETAELLRLQGTRASMAAAVKYVHVCWFEMVELATLLRGFGC